MLLYLVTKNLILLIINMVRTNGNLSRCGSHDAPRVLHRVLHGGDRPLQLVEGVSTRLMLFRMMSLSMRFPMFLRTRSRGLITMVQDFQGMARLVRSFYKYFILLLLCIFIVLCFFFLRIEL